MTTINQVTDEMIDAGVIELTKDSIMQISMQHHLEVC